MLAFSTQLFGLNFNMGVILCVNVNNVVTDNQIILDLF
jgi:hypothetical protein